MKFLARLVIGLVVLVMNVPFLIPSAAAQDGTRLRCVSVWYPSSEHPGGLDSITNNLDVIQEINPFWYTARPDGSIDAYDGAEDADKLAAWRDAGLLILPTIANASPFAVTDDVRDSHIEAIVALVERMGYDGIDIDYESFPLWTRDDFSLFIEKLAERLHAHERLLSIAVHAKTTDQTLFEGSSAQDWARLAPAVDIFKIMTYDYTNRNSRDPGPIGPTTWSSDVLAYAATVTDLSKVRLGLHFYGYRWQRNDVATVTWEGVQRTIEAYDITVERDPADMEAWFRLKVAGLPAQTVYFADSVGLAYKLDRIYSDHPTLGGVAIWGLGGEDPSNWDVLRNYQPIDCKP